MWSGKPAEQSRVLLSCFFSPLYHLFAILFLVRPISQKFSEIEFYKVMVSKELNSVVYYESGRIPSSNCSIFRSLPLSRAFFAVLVPEFSCSSLYPIFFFQKLQWHILALELLKDFVNFSGLDGAFKIGIWKFLSVRLNHVFNYIYFIFC